jgi:2-haloacid dehalogenase
MNPASPIATETQGHLVAFKPKFISFDCYGTLIKFEMGPAASRLFMDRLPANRMHAF